MIWSFAGDTTASDLGQINGEPAGPHGVRGRADIRVQASTQGGLMLNLWRRHSSIMAEPS